ncbi:MAG: LLM class flavin-dependent oxidoreductase [Acidimicrobiales bacterium]|nr:LLM class flavin-dependent oxidoreductase [Acidimicrobiales bacterium]
MNLDVMVGPASWEETVTLARNVERAGFAGMLFTETSSVPWMRITAAAMAAPSLFFTTGIAVAFPRSPMVSAAVAYEIAANTGGRFRLGLGSQVRAHVKRRYSADFSRPAARMREYVEATKACFRAFNGEEKLHYEGEFYNLSLLPSDWAPPPHDFPVKVDISAVGPLMVRTAAEVADGIHVHPFHSRQYLENRLIPNCGDVDLIAPVFAVAGDSPEERAPMLALAKQQIAFYGTTPNYSFQFDDLGFEGTTNQLRRQMKAGDLQGMEQTITDEMVENFAVVCRWDEMADRLIERYGRSAERVALYLLDDELRRNPAALGKWGEVARAVKAG